MSLIKITPNTKVNIKGNATASPTIYGWDILGSEIVGIPGYMEALGYGWGYGSPRGISLNSDGNIFATGQTDSDWGAVYQWNSSTSTWDIMGEPFEDKSTNVCLNSSGNRLGIGNRIVEWNGTSWVQMGNNLPNPFYPSKLNAEGNSVFSAYGTQITNFDWDGNSWVQAGSITKEMIFDDVDIPSGSVTNVGAGYWGEYHAINSDGSVIVYSATINTPVVVNGTTLNPNGYTYYEEKSRVYAIFEKNGNIFTKKGETIVKNINWKYDMYDLTNVDINSSGDRICFAYIGGTPSNDEYGPYNTSVIEIYDWNGTSWVQAGNSIIIEHENPYFYLIHQPKLSDSGDTLVVRTRAGENSYLDVYNKFITYKFVNNNWVKMNYTIIEGQEVTGEDAPVAGRFDINSDGTVIANALPAFYITPLPVPDNITSFDNHDRSGRVTVYKLNKQ